jgi:hypothetical protein
MPPLPRHDGPAYREPAKAGDVELELITKIVSIAEGCALRYGAQQLVKWAMAPISDPSPSYEDQKQLTAALGRAPTAQELYFFQKAYQARAKLFVQPRGGL